MDGIVVSFLLAALGAAPSAAPTQGGGGGGPSGVAGQGELAGTVGRGPVEADVFHPDNQPGADGVRPQAPAPRRGGRVVVHLAARPSSWNRTVDNNSVVSTVHASIHEFLLERDPVTWAFRSSLAREWIVEDRVVVRSGPDGTGQKLVGEVQELGEELLVTPRAPGNPLQEAVRVATGDVVSIDRAVVYTFRLRDDAVWHDGQPFDARDVYFSWRIYWNPTVDCDHDRDELQSFVDAQVIDAHTIRFEGGEQYFAYPLALSNLCLLPSHLYDLTDEDNERYMEGIDLLGEEQGRFVNEHPGNRFFVGLGPYRVTNVGDDFLEAERFEDYFDADPAGGRGGWLDGIRWRILTDRGAARTAMLEGELDYCEQLSSGDLFGAFVRQEAFTERLYAGYAYRPQMQYVAWNTRRPHLSDPRVRRALAHACDWQGFLDGQANGLGLRVTGTAYNGHPSYDDSIEPLAYDPDLAEELLDEAGWYDRDGDDIRDKDGRPLRIEFLSSGGVSSLYARVLQEGLSRVGVQLDIVPLDTAALYERLRAKDFDTVARAWFLDPENDPVQIWGSWTGDPAEDRSTNYPGWGDASTDAAIDVIRRTIDDEERWRLMRELQRRIYADQPYLFLFAFPVKFAVSQRVRGFKSYGLQPGYSLRDWYIVEE